MIILFTDLLKSSLFTAILFAAAHGCGKKLLPNLNFWRDLGLAWAPRIAIGLLILSALLFSVASIHSLTPVAIRYFIGLCAWIAVAEVFSFRLKNLRIEWPGVVAALWFVGAAVFLILPATEKDELIYHLEVPRQMLAQRGWAVLPDNIYALFPQFAELFFAVDLSFLGETAAKMFHFTFGGLIAVTLYRFARAYAPRFASFLAAALFVTAPSAWRLMTCAYVDLAFTWYALLSLIAAQALIQKRSFGALVLTGILCGVTACIKYTGIQWTFLLTGWLLIQSLFQRKLHEGIVSAIGIGLISGTLFLPYFLRNAVLSGWPFYPFPLLHGALKAGWNWDITRAGYYLIWLKTYGVPAGSHALWPVLIAPLRIFWAGRFDDPSNYDGVLGPVFLLIPIVCFMKKTGNFPRSLGWFGLLFLYFWTMTTLQARFLIPILPVACVFLACAFSQTKRSLVLLIACGCLIFNFSVISQEVSRLAPAAFLTGKESREDYLLRQNRAYAMLSAANRLLLPGAKIYLLQMKNYGYFLKRKWTADFIFERYRLEKRMRENPSAESVAGFFKETQSTHLMVDQKALRNEQSGLLPEELKPFDLFLGRYTKLIAAKDGMELYQLNQST